MTTPQQTTAHEATLKRIEDALAALKDSDYELTLFVTGASSLSATAIDNVRQLCEHYLSGRYHLSVVDLFDNPAAAKRSGVLASPTLVKHLPLPVRRLVGDLSKTDKVLMALEIPHSGRASTLLG